MSENIQKVVDDGKCCSCGICSGVCPKSAISVEMENGILTPEVNKEECIQCGLCEDVCPGKSSISEYVSLNPNDVKTYCIGAYRAAEICRSSDKILLEKATSGGIVSSIIYTLLKDKDAYGYVAAFTVKKNNFDSKVKTEICKEPEDLIGTEKSRYISVSQEDAVRYMLAHREEKIIITGTSCAVQGISNVIQRFQLKRDNYLLIGLFCDKLMSYHVWDYFDGFGGNAGKLKELYFRDKGKNGWPGDLKLVQKDATVFLPREMRSQVKDIFCHPRCIYCIDKLNRYADISVGDNYTQENAYPMGSSCVIVRSEGGMKAYEAVKNGCLANDTTIEKIVASQEVSKKVENVCFARYKYGNEKIPGMKLKLKYHYKLLKILMGKKFYSNKYIMKICIKLDTRCKL